MEAVKRALLSVSDKSGLVDFAKGLTELGVELIATGGTASMLQDAGLTIKEVSDVTGFPEILNGRLKTLHPKIFGGLLYRRDDASHKQQCAENDIDSLDMVVVNLYPFEETVAREGVTLAEAIEKIDIGGPSLLRAAAKNHADVTTVPDAAYYDDVLESMRANNGAVDEAFRRKLAGAVFELTAGYDRAIADYLASEESGDELPDRLSIPVIKVADLRYGENPHQNAAAYRDAVGEPAGLFAFEQVQGKPLSFNNYLDLDGARRLVADFDGTTCVIIKHTNPCGVARGATMVEAFTRALSCDPLSAFGGIVGCNQEVDLATAEEIAKTFFESVIAPSFSAEALERLGKKKKLVLLRYSGDASSAVVQGRDIKRVSGGFVIQDYDVRQLTQDDIKVATKRQPTDEEMAAMQFGWKIVKHAKSNGIVFSSADQLLGIGVGQMSRVDSTEIAIRKAGQSDLSLQGSIVASDAFFPFRDGVDAAVRVGATAIIQPGGSIRDEEVIAAADEAGIAMVLTGYRVFKH
jgi:phosphoribosylaminoimidazolecarboxamide formyltransferase / IMP cyclohydrolase